MTIDNQLVEKKTPAKIQGMFGEIAPTYDFLNHLLSFNVDHFWRWYTAKKIVTPGMETILDVCGGTGDLTIALKKRSLKYRKDTEIICSDFTPRMTKLAKEKFNKLPFQSNNLIPMVADTTCLPFGDAQFDLVTVAFGIRNVVDTRQGLREMCRVCKPGGKVAVLEFSHPSNPIFRRLYDFYFFKVLAWIGSKISGSKAYVYLSRSVEAFPDSKAFDAMMGEIAGGPHTYHRLTGGIATLYIAEVRK